MPPGGPVLPREAIAFLRSKGLKPSAAWLSVWREEHASAFTVAQMTRQDLLRQTHREVRRALRRGETFEMFRARLEPWLREKGWAPEGRGGAVPKRLHRIYHTNLRTAHAAGQWDRIARTEEGLPWLVYEIGPSEVHRDEHVAWAGLCLRVSDPWWRTHYPPNGWGCKCRVRQAAEPPRGAPTDAPRIRTRPWTNPATGETLAVPQGIDPGWDYHPAAHAGLGPQQALTDRLQRMTAPGGGPRARRGAVLGLARRAIERHVEGPSFDWFVGRASGWDGLEGKAAPVALLPAGVRKALGVRTPIAVLTDEAAGRQARRRRVPAALWAELQEVVDRVEPRADGGRWVFDRGDGRRLVVGVRGGVAEVLEYYQRRGRRAGRPGAAQRPATGAAARVALLEATAAAREELKRAEGRLRRSTEAINDITRPVTSADLRRREDLATARDAAQDRVRDVARGWMLRDAPAPFRDGAEPGWSGEQLRRQWSAELDSWRRLVAPDLVRRRAAPRVEPSAEAWSAAAYWENRVMMRADAGPGVMIHELSHLLEADRETFRSAVAFLRRRTAGDAITTINERGDPGRRDRWRDPSGKPDYYPGRIFRSERPSPGVHVEALEPGLDVYATEIPSMGVQWLWKDPVGFARTDPEYFDFIWDTLVR